MRFSSGRRARHSFIALVTVGGAVALSAAAMPAAQASSPTRASSSTHGKPAPAAVGTSNGPTVARHPLPQHPSSTTELIVMGTRSTSLAKLRTATSSTRTKFKAESAASLPSINAIGLKVPNADAQAAAAALRKQAGVKSVEIAVARHFDVFTPNDTLYAADQASYLGTSAVNAPTAWLTDKGSSSVKIAVIDSGMAVSHEDLSSKVVAQYNAYNDINGGDTSDVTDDVGHGTFVGGVAAAATGNSLGVAGAGFNSSLMAVKIADPAGNIDLLAEINGINWAVTNGASVINTSFGSDQQSPAEAQAIANAQAAGVVVVASAGNEGNIGDPTEYPADYPGVISVGATDTTNTLQHRAFFSEFGAGVSVGAPGVHIESTTNPAGSFFWPAGNYNNGDGTSFSAPIVAGEAALLKAADPTATVAQIRTAIINSAHGYAGQGLGTGQVDFGAALLHLPPQTTPTSIDSPSTSTASSGLVTLSAHTTAPKVQFVVDGTKVGAPVAAVSGVATTTWPSWGQTQESDHTLAAYDCAGTTQAECSTQDTTESFQVANTAPTVTSPVASDLPITGVIHLAATTVDSSGAVEFYVDGNPVAFAAHSPYLGLVSSSSLPAGSHVITAAQCSGTTVATCNGPVSSPVDIQDNGTTHPTLAALAANPFSPNGDGVKDTTSAAFNLDQAATAVNLSVYDSAGNLQYSHNYGAMTAGSHTLTWNGKTTAGAVVPNGFYTVAAMSTNSFGQSGAGIRPVTVDNLRPTLVGAKPSGVTFYPYPDGFGDTFKPSVTLNKAATLSLVITTATGAPVRTISASKPAGAQYLGWTGYWATGHIGPAGKYLWQFVATDLAGNTTKSVHYVVYTSAKKLVAKTVHITENGNQFTDVLAFDNGVSNCLFYDNGFGNGDPQVYAHGVDLFDQCDLTQGNGSQDIGSLYTFTVPVDTVYSSLNLVATGRTLSGAGTIFGGWNIIPTQGTTSAQTYPQNGIIVTSTATHSYGLGSVSPSFHIDSKHHVFIEFDLTNDNGQSFNDFDLENITLTVNGKVLQ